MSPTPSDIQGRKAGRVRGYDSLGSHRAQQGRGVDRDYPLYQTIQTLSLVQHGFNPVQNPNLSEKPVKSVFLGTYTLSVYILGEGALFCTFPEAKANLRSHFAGAIHLVFIEGVRVSP